MLDDRSYMRDEDSYRSRWSASMVLIVVLTVIFALQKINEFYIGSSIPADYLALTDYGLRHGWVWQLLSFQFVHTSLFHLLGNALTLWFIGRSVEGVLGTKRFLWAYFICGVAGGLLQGSLMLAFPNHFGDQVYGASAGTSGIFAIFAMMAGESEIRLNFILPIKARVLLYIVGGIALFFTLVPTDRGVAHAAHLGGILAGIGYLRFDARRAAAQWGVFQSRQRKKQLVQAASKAIRFRPKSSPSVQVEIPSEEFISKEVDPILDKISAHGIHSLTDREKQVLEAARSRMAKR